MIQKTAKEIYFDNFGSLLTMKRNGEYRNYIKKRGSLEQEHEWSVEIKNILVDAVINKKDFVKIVPLSRVNLPESEIVEAFKTISLQCSDPKVRESLDKLKILISPNIYERIVVLFK